MALPTANFNSLTIKEKEVFLVAEVKNILWVQQELEDLEASRWKIDPLFSDYKILKFQDEKNKNEFEQRFKSHGFNATAEEICAKKEQIESRLKRGEKSAADYQKAVEHATKVLAEANAANEKAKAHLLSEEGEKKKI